MSDQQSTPSDAAAAPSLSDVPEGAVAERAYRLWQQRGCPVGDAEQDWFTALAELAEERHAAVVPEPGGSPKKN